MKVLLVEDKPSQPNQEEIAWIHEGIVVKILDDKVKGGKLFKKKGVIKEIYDKFVGLVVIENS